MVKKIRNINNEIDVEVARLDKFLSKYPIVGEILILPVFIMCWFLAVPFHYIYGLIILEPFTVVQFIKNTGFMVCWLMMCLMVRWLYFGIKYLKRK